MYACSNSMQSPSNHTIRVLISAAGSGIEHKDPECQVVVLHIQCSSFFSDSVISLKRSKVSNDVVIAVCFASVMAMLLALASYCYCSRVRKKRRNEFSKGKDNF